MSDKEVYKWFIAHVVHRNESNVKSLLEIAGLEYYMPFQRVTRTWNNHKKEIQKPVIPSCVFVRVLESDFIMLQMMNEITLMQSREDSFISLSEEEMKAFLQKLESSENIGESVLNLLSQFDPK